MKSRFVQWCLAGVIAVTLSGCASYYKVTDPGSGRTYYTDNVKKKGSGAVKFRDEVSKQSVTLLGSEVLEITEDEYKAATHYK